MSLQTPRILAFAGSTRTGSYNKLLVRIAATAAEVAGAEVTLVDLRDLQLPLFDQDLERREGIPENGARLKQLMVQSNGFLISSPEYNSSISGVLKNAIDWASRRQGDEPPLIAFRGKAAALMSASPGSLGGLRGLVHLRAILGNLGMLVLPEQRAISAANEAFAEDGSLKSERDAESVNRLGSRLVAVVRGLATADAGG